MRSIGVERHLHCLPTFDAAAGTAEAVALVDDPDPYLAEVLPGIGSITEAQRRHADAILTCLETPR